MPIIVPKGTDPSGADKLSSTLQGLGQVKREIDQQNREQQAFEFDVQQATQRAAMQKEEHDVAMQERTVQLEDRARSMHGELFNYKQRVEQIWDGEEPPADLQAKHQRAMQIAGGMANPESAARFLGDFQSSVEQERVQREGMRVTQSIDKAAASGALGPEGDEATQLAWEEGRQLAEQDPELAKQWLTQKRQAFQVKRKAEMSTQSAMSMADRVMVDPNISQTGLGAAADVRSAFEAEVFSAPDEDVPDIVRKFESELKRAAYEIGPARIKIGGEEFDDSTGVSMGHGQPLSKMSNNQLASLERMIQPQVHKQMIDEGAFERLEGLYDEELTQAKADLETEYNSRLKDAITNQAAAFNWNAPALGDAIREINNGGDAGSMAGDDVYRTLSGISSESRGARVKEDADSADSGDGVGDAIANAAFGGSPLGERLWNSGLDMNEARIEREQRKKAEDEEKLRNRAGGVRGAAKNAAQNAPKGGSKKK